MYKIDITETAPVAYDAAGKNITFAKGIIVCNFANVGVVFYSDTQDGFPKELFLMFDKDRQGSKFYKSAKRAFRKHGDDPSVPDKDAYSEWYAKKLMEKYLYASKFNRNLNLIISGRIFGFKVTEAP